MQQLGTYQTRISDYGGVNRSAGERCIGGLGRALRPGAAEVVC